jgi:hypothetical protein
MKRNAIKFKPEQYCGIMISRYPIHTLKRAYNRYHRLVNKIELL